MSLFFNLKSISIISIAAFSLIVTGQIAQAETPIEINKPNTSSNLQQQTSFASTQAIKPNNLQQFTSSSNFNTFASQTSSNNLQKSGHKTAQTQIEIEPGRTTRSGSSYIGLGGNIGIDGDTSLGNGSFAAISKIGLTDSISFRPTALVDDDAIFLLPLTVDFFREEVSDTGFDIAPYVGGGLSLNTGEGDTVGIVATGGLDIPLSSDFTANAAANVKFIDDTDVGIVLGVGYNL